MGLKPLLNSFKLCHLVLVLNTNLFFISHFYTASIFQAARAPGRRGATRGWSRASPGPRCAARAPPVSRSRSRRPCSTSTATLCRQSGGGLRLPSTEAALSSTCSKWENILTLESFVHYCFSRIFATHQAPG